MSIEAIRAALEAGPPVEYADCDLDERLEFLRQKRHYEAALSATCNPSAIRELLDRLDAAEKAVQWQPIETAPDERGIYLVRIGDQTHIAQFDPRMSSAKWWHPYGLPARLERQPTHWIPLPAAPAAMEGE